jgi:hypothetical protein
MPILLILIILLSAVSAFICGLRWGGNGILGSLAGCLILSLTLSLLLTFLTRNAPMFAHAPLYARAAFVAASFSFQGIVGCVVGALGGWAGIALRRRKAKAITAKTAEAFE